MYILFKRHGIKRFFKRYDSFDELDQEINKGHNEKFQGNNQFYYNLETKEVVILNNRLSIYDCESYLESAHIRSSEMSA